MSWGPLTVFIQTMASAGTATTYSDLGRSWKQLYLEIPTMTSNTQLHIKGTSDPSRSFRRIYHPSIASTTIETDVFAIASASTNCLVPIPNGVRYIQVESTATVDNGCVFYIIASD